MKKLYILTLACLLSGVAMAQETSGTTASGIKYGIKAGVNFATVSLSGNDVDKEEKDALKSQTSFLIGGLVDIPVGTSFSIQPGLTLSGKGSKSEYSEEGYSETGQTNVMYLEIPVNAVYKIGGLYLGAGPYAAFAISGKQKEEEKEEGEPVEKEERDLEFGTDPEKHDLKRGDFGINVLAGYQLSNGLNFGVNYGLGLSNILPDYKDADYKAKNRVFSVTVGFSF